jgi:alkanesulfonate monooxygenase SsuD/methylene tetrahydromethanopterin reductase-like flavin-dependent oxidoreductase (luciferase family)
VSARIPVVLNVARAYGQADALETARTAVAAGLDGVGLPDSPRLFADSLVETERVLAGSTARLAGPCVLSLGLRHPATVASAVRTLASHHPGRVLTVVGRGESSVRNEGLAVPSMGAYRESLGRLSQLVGDEGSVRLLGAASGPRTIAATAELLGGVLLDVGARPDVLARAVDVVRRENPAADVWTFLRAVVTRSDEEVAAATLPVLGSCAFRLLRAPEWFGVAAESLEGIRRVAAAHDYRRHGTGEARAAATGLEDADTLVRNRFVVTGSPRRIAEHLADVARLGVGGVVLAGALDGVLERLGDLATAVRDGLSPQVPSVGQGRGDRS